MNDSILPRLVLLHGRDKPFEIKGEVERQFVDAVRFGLERAGAPYHDTIKAELAFYGDIWRDEDAVGGPEGSIQVPSATAQLEKALAAEMVAVAGASTAGAEAGIIMNTLQGLLATLEAHFPLGDVVLPRFLRDLFEYLTQPELREKVINRVVETFDEAGGEVVLLAHSMGTFVGYDLLRRRPDLLVRAFFSFGSPLGYTSARRHMADENGETLFPPNLPRWINVYNEDDFATAVRHLAPLFPSDDGRMIEDIEAQGKPVGIFSIGGGHDPSVYLSSMALAQKLRSVLEDPNPT
jgi:hypothetical protein